MLFPYIFQEKTKQPSEDSHITTVRISHSGNYSCTAENELGLVDSDDITKDVKCN